MDILVEFVCGKYCINNSIATVIENDNYEMNVYVNAM